MENEPKKLYRSKKERVLLGVCGGIADYFGVDPVLIRIIFIFLFFVKGIGVCIYLISLLLVPLEPKEKISLPPEERAQSLVNDLTKKN